MAEEEQDSVKKQAQVLFNRKFLNIKSADTVFII